MILDNGYEIPEGMESLSCIFNCGFIILWAVGNDDGVGDRMETHYDLCPARKAKSTFRTKGE